MFPGGVYNSPEANAYWARRFGFSSVGGSEGGLRGGLRLVMERINQQALQNRGLATP